MTPPVRAAIGRVKSRERRWSPSHDSFCCPVLDSDDFASPGEKPFTLLSNGALPRGDERYERWRGALHIWALSKGIVLCYIEWLTIEPHVRTASHRRHQEGSCPRRRVDEALVRLWLRFSLVRCAQSHGIMSYAAHLLASPTLPSKIDANPFDNINFAFIIKESVQ